MSDTARDYQTIECASTEGLEALFTGPVTRTDCDPVNLDRSDSSDKGPVTDIYWTPQEAASYFGVSVRTIRRRLQDGSLAGRKVNGLNGPEWQVDPVTRTDNDPVDPDSSDGPDNDPVTVSATNNSTVADKLLDYLREKDELLLSKEKDLQAASATIGYLKAQLEAQEQEIKLLTDSQHRGGWWARFSSWFFGRR